MPEEHYAVVYKRPSDLALLRDLPICANLLVADMFDEGVHMHLRCRLHQHAWLHLWMVV